MHLLNKTFLVAEGKLERLWFHQDYIFAIDLVDTGLLPISG